jgi:hypothetical protein
MQQIFLCGSSFFASGFKLLSLFIYVIVTPGLYIFSASPEVMEGLDSCFGWNV